MNLNWDDTRIFLAIARTGTLTAAAEQLGLGIATVSRRLERLECLMPSALFTRHQNGYQLTHEGDMLLAYAENLEHAALAFNEAAQLQSKAEGLVRLAVAENLANTFILPSLPTLLQQHPHLRLEINSGSQLMNLHRRDADLAVRTLKPEVGNLTIKRLGTLRFGLYAAPHYLESLHMHQYRYIGWSETHQHLTAAKWLSRYLKGQVCALETNSLSTQIHAVKAGLGIGLIPHFIADDLGLIKIENDLEIEQPIWLAAHTNLLSSKRIRTVMDHLINLFESCEYF